MKKILIVDDLDTYIQRERSILNRSDFKIFTATSGEDALAIHRSEHMDMVIIDMDMPGMSGDKLCSIIRKDEKLKNVSVVMVCSNTRGDIERSKTCMANAYVTKPLNTVQFLMTVSKLLDIQERKSYRVLIKLSVSGKARSESFFCYSREASPSSAIQGT
ncbi:MAG: response regulator [Nitrospirae bacterium]|nr:response regulator [Nitrospirota bacterium]